MKPPWVEAPHIPQGMGWRMGYGENLIHQFAEWFVKLTPDAREEYISQTPEPDGWAGFYRDIDDYLLEE